MGVGAIRLRKLEMHYAWDGKTQRRMIRNKGRASVSVTFQRLRLESEWNGRKKSGEGGEEEKSEPEIDFYSLLLAGSFPEFCPQQLIERLTS